MRWDGHFLLASRGHFGPRGPTQDDSVYNFEGFSFSTIFDNIIDTDDAADADNFAKLGFKRAGGRTTTCRSA